MPHLDELARTIISKKGLKISEEQVLAVFDKLISSSFQQGGAQAHERPLRQPDRRED